MYGSNSHGKLENIIMPSMRIQYSGFIKAITYMKPFVNGWFCYTWLVIWREEISEQHGNIYRRINSYSIGAEEKTFGMTIEYTGSDLLRVRRGDILGLMHTETSRTCSKGRVSYQLIGKPALIYEHPNTSFPSHLKSAQLRVERRDVELTVHVAGKKKVFMQYNITL